MKFVKTVDQIAFGNHKLKNFGLASLLIGAAATVAGVLTIGASATSFYAGDDGGQALMQGGYNTFMEVVTNK